MVFSKWSESHFFSKSFYQSLFMENFANANKNKIAINTNVRKIISSNKFRMVIDFTAVNGHSCNKILVNLFGSVARETFWYGWCECKRRKENPSGKPAINDSNKIFKCPFKVKQAEIIDI